MFGTLGVLCAIVSALIWTLAARAQTFSLHAAQSVLWSAQSSTLNMYAAVVAVVAAVLLALAFFLQHKA
jgi:hypothetical protein